MSRLIIIIEINHYIYSSVQNLCLKFLSDVKMITYRFVMQQITFKLFLWIRENIIIYKV